MREILKGMGLGFVVAMLVIAGMILQVELYLKYRDSKHGCVNQVDSTPMTQREYDYRDIRFTGNEEEI